MNEQKPPGGIEWTRIRNPDGTIRRGYTWNPIGGCLHGCRWQMPDGDIAECYAKTIAERLAVASYPYGFEAHYWHPQRLDEPLDFTESAGIFLDSMADLMGVWVPEAEVEAVLATCRSAHWHQFQLLTKNAPRLLKFRFPGNVWLGASSPPDWFRGVRLSPRQQQKMLTYTLGILSRLSEWNITWMSFEPLSWDVAAIVAQYPHALRWAVVGAASDGQREFPPRETHLRHLLRVLDDLNVPVFFKGNLRSSRLALSGWREMFPVFSEQPVQRRLFL